MCVGSEFQVDGAVTENVRDVKLTVMPKVQPEDLCWKNVRLWKFGWEVMGD